MSNVFRTNSMKISNKKVRFINCPMDNVSTIFRNHGAMFAIMVQCSQSWCNVRNRSFVWWSMLYNNILANKKRWTSELD